ncbi:hypothetical protein Tco_0520387 [Tanacetum coccineum]
MAEPILSDNLEKAPTESNLSITSNDINIELSKEFLVELRKNIYHGTYNEDVVDHIVKVLKMVDLIYVPGVDSHQLRMKVFPLSLADDAKEWWISEEITTWEELVEKFFCRFYPESYDGEDEIISSSNELKESKYENPSNTATDSFFKAYEVRDIEKQSQTKRKYSNTSNSINELPNKRRCKTEKFEAIQYSLGPNEEYIAIRMLPGRQPRLLFNFVIESVFPDINTAFSEEVVIFSLRVRSLLCLFVKDVPWVDDKRWTDAGIWTKPTPVKHTCKPFNYKTGCSEWPTCGWKDDGYCNGGNLPGAYIIGNQLHYQDYEWYEALEDCKLKDEALRNKAIMEGSIKEDDDESHYEQNRQWNTYTNYDDAYEINHEHNKNKELCEIHELPVCNIRRYMMIKYSFNDDEEYVAVKEDEYDDLTVTRKEACRAYQEIFQIMDEGWMVTRAE